MAKIKEKKEKQTKIEKKPILEPTKKVKKEKIKIKKEKVKKESKIKALFQELKKVSWPSRKDVLKYSIATLVFCFIVMSFFQLLDLGLSIIKGVFN